MNPIFPLLVLLVAVILWFLLSFLSNAGAKNTPILYRW